MNTIVRPRKLLVSDSSRTVGGKWPNEPVSTFEPMVRRILAKAWVPPK
jgi:hypothetical protein